jgi:NAD(P)H-dependent flavin oxidoreductase YrpB (nitropropane dioxygenase family)
VAGKLGPKDNKRGKVPIVRDPLVRSSSAQTCLARAIVGATAQMIVKRRSLENILNETKDALKCYKMKGLGVLGGLTAPIELKYLINLFASAIQKIFWSTIKSRCI